MDAMKKALMGRRGKGLDISLIVGGPGKELEIEAENPQEDFQESMMPAQEEDFSKTPDQEMNEDMQMGEKKRIAMEQGNDESMDDDKMLTRISLLKKMRGMR